METSDVKPWYKQFWPWFLIAIPTSSFIMAYFIVKFATNTQDSLVVDDYYKEGKAFFICGEALCLVTRDLTEAWW